MWKESLNSDGQHSPPSNIKQKNKTNNHLSPQLIELNLKKDHDIWCWNPGPGLEQAQKCGRVKSPNYMYFQHPVLLLISIDNRIFDHSRLPMSKRVGVRFQNLNWTCMYAFWYKIRFSKFVKGNKRLRKVIFLALAMVWIPNIIAFIYISLTVLWVI